MVWDYLPHHILCMVFQEKYFSFSILLTEQISFCLVEFTSRGTCCPVFTSYILILNLAFLSSHFLKWQQKSGQKFKYLNNEKSF